MLIYSNNCFRLKMTLMTRYIYTTRAYLSSDNCSRLSLFQSRNQIKMRKSGKRPSNFISAKRNVGWIRVFYGMQSDLSKIAIRNYKILNQGNARKLAIINEMMLIYLWMLSDISLLTTCWIELLFMSALFDNFNTHFDIFYPLLIPFRTKYIRTHEYFVSNDYIFNKRKIMSLF